MVKSSTWSYRVESSPIREMPPSFWANQACFSTSSATRISSSCVDLPDQKASRAFFISRLGPMRGNPIVEEVRLLEAIESCIENEREQIRC